MSTLGQAIAAGQTSSTFHNSVASSTYSPTSAVGPFAGQTTHVKSAKATNPCALDAAITSTGSSAFGETDVASTATSKLHTSVKLAITSRASRNWELFSTAQIQDTIFSDEDKKTWESCKQALTAFGFGNGEEDKILGKAFGQIHSPYWGEERKKEVPNFEVVNEIISYLKDLGLTDDDVGTILKKFPEVLGCSIENELKENVRILEKDWGIKGKTLRNLLLRNPTVLGYNIDFAKEIVWRNALAAGLDFSCHYVNDFNCRCIGVLG